MQVLLDKNVLIHFAFTFTVACHKKSLLALFFPHHNVSRFKIRNIKKGQCAQYLLWQVQWREPPDMMMMMMMHVIITSSFFLTKMLQMTSLPVQHNLFYLKLFLRWSTSLDFLIALSDVDSGERYCSIKLPIEYSKNYLKFLSVALWSLFFVSVCRMSDESSRYPLMRILSMVTFYFILTLCDIM